MILSLQCGKSFQCCTNFGRSDFRTSSTPQRPSFCIFSQSVVRDTRKSFAASPT